MLNIKNHERTTNECSHNFLEVNLKIFLNKEQSSLNCSNCGKKFYIDLACYFSYDHWLWLIDEHRSFTNAQCIYVGGNKYEPIYCELKVSKKFSKKLWIKLGRIYVK